MNVEPASMLMEQWPSHPRNIGLPQRVDDDDFMNDRLMDTNRRGGESDVGAVPVLLPPRLEPPHLLEASDLLRLRTKGRVGDRQGEGAGVDAVKSTTKGLRPTSPPMAGASPPLMSSANNNSLIPCSSSSRAGDSAVANAGSNSGGASGSYGDDDASHMTSITLELRKAAKKTIRHARSKRAVHAAVPREVKEAMLEEEFPHVRTRNRDGPADASAESGRGGGDVDSTRAERSSLDHVVDERETTGGDHDNVNYDDCVRTLSASEMLHLRSSMYNYEKQRVTMMMAHLSDQLKAFHELLEENQFLKEEATKAKKEKDDRISELESSLIEMKLNLAQYQGREDHHRLSEARLRMDLKRAQDELGGSSSSPKELKPCPVTVHRRGTNPTLTKSMSSADEVASNVRSGEPIKRKNVLLTRSWFGREGLSILDRSFRREDSNGDKQGFAGSPRRSSNQNSDRQEPTSPPSPKPTIPTRSRSFVDPEKARERAAKRASKEFEFMPWNTSESQSSLPRSEADEQGATTTPVAAAPGPGRQQRPKSRSFVDPKKARSAVGGGPIVGSDVFLPRPASSNHNDVFESRSTFLSNITDITFEDGSETDAAREVAEEALRALFKESLLARCENNDDARFSSALSGGSLSTLEFEPAMPQLQRAMSLRNPWDGAPDDDGDGGGNGSRPQLERMAMSMRCPRAQPKEGRPPQLQKAVSLRGRNKEGKKKASAGDDYLAFC